MRPHCSPSTRIAVECGYQPDGTLVSHRHSQRVEHQQVFPGVINAATIYQFRTYTITNSAIGTNRFVQIIADDLAVGGVGAEFVSAYLTAYAPTAQSTNYLGDAGFAGDDFPNDPGFFQVFVPAGKDLVVVVTSINAALSGNAAYNLRVEAFVDSKYNEAPPVITSAPTATPQSGGRRSARCVQRGGTGRRFAHVCLGFRDGTQAPGNSPSHVYVAPGTYTATVTISDGFNSTTGSVSVTVNAAVPIVGSGPDSDGDGFSDAIETAGGSDPHLISSTPTGNPITVAGLQPLTITKVSIKLNFAKPVSDSISFSGTVAIPAGFNPVGAKVLIDSGGVAKSVTLNAKGNDSVKITVKAKKGVVLAQTSKYAAKFLKGNFAATLAAAGLTNAKTKSATVMATFTLIVNGTVLQKTQTMKYTNTSGKTGSAK